MVRTVIPLHISQISHLTPHPSFIHYYYQCVHTEVQMEQTAQAQPASKGKPLPPSSGRTPKI